MALEIARMLASPEGMRLVATIKRMVATQGLPIGTVMKQSVEHLDRLETLASGPAGQ